MGQGGVGLGGVGWVGGWVGLGLGLGWSGVGLGGVFFFRDFGSPDRLLGQSHVRTRMYENILSPCMFSVFGNRHGWLIRDNI